MIVVRSGVSGHCLIPIVACEKNSQPRQDSRAVGASPARLKISTSSLYPFAFFTFLILSCVRPQPFLPFLYIHFLTFLLLHSTWEFGYSVRCLTRVLNFFSYSACFASKCPRYPPPHQVPTKSPPPPTHMS